MLKKPDFDIMSESEKNAWQDGYNFARVEVQNKLDKKDESITRILAHQASEARRWREAGLTYESISHILNMHEREEISFGKLVEELRGLASASIEKNADV